MTARWSSSTHDGVSLPAHKCKSIYSFDVQVDDPRVPFIYRPAVRAWGIPVFVDDRFPDGWWNDVPLHEVSHCPWCGQDFPPSLYDELREALAALGFEPGDPEVPERFKTDTWWRALDI